jgi:molybdate/tungstate transport system ATP-binding protein
MIRVENLGVRFTDFALRDISLKVARGEFFALLGPTGAGKTLILESIVGLLPLAAGRIRIDGRDVTGLPPEKRGVSIVYQDQALFPHLNVGQNIRFGLRYQSGHPEKHSDRLARLVDQLGLARLLNRSVDHLSGGEKQRVALARALAVAPAVLLLDEPLSSLDPNFREEIRLLLKKLHADGALTVLMVTHDFAEAHFLAQRAAVINRGRIEQIGTVPEVFYHPVNPFVAEFVGMRNIFPARLHGRKARVNQLTFRLSEASDSRRRIAIRPENIHVSRQPPTGDAVNRLTGHVVQIGNQGVYSDIIVECSGVHLHAVLGTGRIYEEKLSEGAPVFLQINPEDIHPM